MATYKVRVINSQGKVESRFAVKAKSFSHANKKASRFWFGLTKRCPEFIEVYRDSARIVEFPTHNYELVKFKC